jgi:hypothetical protein
MTIVRGSIGRVAVCFAALTAAWGHNGTPLAHASDRVVLVSWDGIRRDVLQELLQWQPLGEIPRACPQARHPIVMPTECNGYLTCLPALCNFQIVDSAVTEGKPLTRPQHAQMLSGYGPAETGEITNAGKTSLPPGFTVYERIAAARPEVFTAHIAGRKFVGQGIIRWAVQSGALRLDLRRGGRDNYGGANTTKRVVEALDAIGAKPFFLFVHYKAADVLAHRSSDNGKQYREAIVQNDVQLAGVLQLLVDRDLLPTTEVFVTTDHGFRGIFHVNGSDPAIAQTWFASLRHDLGASASSVLDVTPTVLTTLGIPVDSINPPFRGRSMAR